MGNHHKFTKFIMKSLVIIFGPLSIIFSTVPVLYGGSKEECTSLRTITLVAGIWFITSGVIKKLRDFLPYLEFLKLSADLAMWITIRIFFSQHEDCGALTIYIQVWTLFLVTIATIIVVLICFEHCFGLKDAAEKNQENSETNFQTMPMIQIQQENEE